MYECVCAKAWRGGGSCGDRKDTGAQNQTNKGQAAVIKSSLVLVIQRNTVEWQTMLSSLTQHWTNSLQRIHFCFHLSWHVQGDDCSLSIFFLSSSREGRRAPQPIAATLKLGVLGVWQSNVKLYHRVAWGKQHVHSRQGIRTGGLTTKRHILKNKFKDFSKLLCITSKRSINRPLLWQETTGEN